MLVNQCGAVTYSINIDLANPVAVRCNCSICVKRGYLSYTPTAINEFTLLGGTAMEEER
ncbi:hypothetical protein EXIGLDRAFT_759917 [Exidia glandulosa HHB12029]|uniref:CENP-V/GFA domain-containing protein n=1 Tax=Exidia glandulosa HHB12029 TaxID=1314781 RepID=A0A165PNA3_EXIGL|nr:hypothetical protein EXIGLDRAFT_759917 [Exidia glandulosa HHB12029]